MSMDFEIVCDKCRKYTWFAKTSWPTGGKPTILVSEKGKQFFLEHMLCDVDKGMRIVNENVPPPHEPIPEDYEYLDP